MTRKAWLSVGFGILLLNGCAHKAASSRTDYDYTVQSSGGVQTRYRAALAREEQATLSSSLAMDSPAVEAASRYIAVSHRLVIVEPASSLAKSLETTVAFCGTIQCEVLSSNISGDSSEAQPSGNISVRVAPGDLQKFLDFAARQGKITQHSTETEDKTAQVVDVEAKIKNQTEFRDNLRKMLAKPGVNVADLLKIQESLASAQAELDSEATQRKILANETEKVAINIEFQSERTFGHRGVFAPIGDALRESGSVLAGSLAALITSIAAIIPWLILLIPGGWFLVRLWKKFRSRRALAKAAS